jgi:predicted SnoaL-like aldol condensation-catalyzing enzyme
VEGQAAAVDRQRLERVLHVQAYAEDPDDKSKTYPAYWFDMVRVDNGLVQEHWDAAVKN